MPAKLLFQEAEVTRLLSSIIKSPFISFSEQKKKIEVIDASNKKIINNYSSEKNLSADEVSNENSTEQKELIDNQALQNIHEEIVKKANEEAKHIIEAANKQAMQIEEDAYSKGFEEGVIKGKEEGMQQVSALKLELEEEISAFNENRDNFYRSIEPKIANVITTIVKNMVGILGTRENTILFLVKKGLEEVELQGELIIRVSDEDYDEVIQGKHLIEENMSSQTGMEILKDSRLHKNDCIIETNLGIIDCSLDERMKGLIKQLNLIETSIASSK